MPNDSKELAFEQALEQLEGLVQSLEKGDVPLAQLVDKFEEGNKLIQKCQSRLKEAETRIEMLRQGSEGTQAEAFNPENNAS
ncbi:MAG: exodeoxyribonuclease VII small subunit [Opitutales bacterium]|nr:exodeoxyribonuclease VII small subunit [Opitutales bacterium]